jgi:TonB-dependent starch-binding outer membrane protein SusC
MKIYYNPVINAKINFMRRLLHFVFPIVGRKNIFHDTLNKIAAFLLLIGLALVSQTASAKNFQIINVSGRILSIDGSVISGATITLKGTNHAVISDNAGSYTIEFSDTIKNPVLIVSSTGYVTKEISVTGRTSLDINLEVDIRKLDGVVVVGYGTQRRKDLTGSIASISAAQIQQRPVSTYEDAIAGSAAGIDVSPRSARPGNVAEIVIRGIGTISGDRSPLYVVDGFPTDALNAAAINPGDISSIDILKDASATAIYGSRGANGVILITTKGGRAGQAKVNVAIKSGFAQANKHDYYKVLTGPEYVEWYKEKAQFAGTPIPSWITNYDGHTSTNWQDAIYQTAPFGDYSLNVAGGTDKLTYMFSGSFLHQDDILLNAGFDKYSAMAKIDYKASKRVNMGILLSPNFTKQKLSAPEDDFSSLTGAAVLLPPIIPVRNADGTPTDPNTYGILNNHMVNPLTIAQNWQGSNTNFFLMSNAYIGINILDNLTFKSALGANVSDYDYYLFQQNGMNGQALYPVTATEHNSTRVVNWVSENTLNYKLNFKEDNKLDVLAGYVVQKVDQTNVGANASNYASNLAQTVNFGSTQTAYSGATGNSLISWLGRVNYSYKDRYLLTATIRQDGSSRFGTNKQWGTFPSVGLGWNIANEKFMGGIKAIDHAKLRLTWGETGSNFIGDFSSKGSLNAVNSSFGTTNVVGFVNGDPGNPDLSWEKSDQTDVGFDLGLWNRFSLVFDYYHNQSNGLLLYVNTPPTSGYSSNLQNIGAMKKWGYEFTLNANIINTKDWSWDLGGNASYQRSEVTNLGPDGGPLYQFFHVLVTAVGGPLEQEQVLKQTGILSQKDIDDGVAKKATGDMAGDYKFLDVNKDGLIDAFNGADGYLDGDNNPRWLYGFNTSVRYKNWRFSALFQGQQGAHILDFVYQIMSLHNNNTNMDRYFYDGRYISESQPGNGKVARAGYNDIGAVSSWEIQSTDFLRIRNLSLSYSFPSSTAQKVWTDNLRIYVSVENLYTWKSYEGGNPEAVRNGFDTQVFGDHRTLGLNSVATAPIPQTFILGLNFSF